MVARILLRQRRSVLSRFTCHAEPLGIFGELCLGLHYVWMVLQHVRGGQVGSVLNVGTTEFLVLCREVRAALQMC